MKFVLPIIVVSQFLCTSLWFAGNSIINDIVKNLHFDHALTANLTSAIQFGFITGTLVFAIFNISDRFSPSLVFFLSSILAGLFNLGITFDNIHSAEILTYRFLTGFFLAGIYPVGMKIASDHFQSGLGKSLGFLVGALVLGTAFPHLLKSLSIGLYWKHVLYFTTILSLVGGLSIFLLVPDGPYYKASQKITLTAFMNGFSNKHFRAASFGYFGHMWELYTFWAFVPIMLDSYIQHNSNVNLSIPLFSFLVIALGAIACAFTGIISYRYGAKKIATISLFISCLCCLASPLFIYAQSVTVFLCFLIIWGLAVIADSPMFSTLVAQNAPADSRGTSITIVNCLGFFITIISIQTISYFTDKIDPQYVYLPLAIGPVFGLIALFREGRS